MTARCHDLTGQRIGILRVLEREQDRNGAAYWRCACDCGTTKVIRAQNLKRGWTRSCGCLRRLPFGQRPIVDRSKLFKPTSYSRTHKREFSSWSNMIARCSDPASPKFPLYGGRGIRVCGRWQKFENFFADLGARPAGTSLDRINNDGHYEPGNCRWATGAVQSANRRTTTFVEVDGQRIALAVFAAQHGIPHNRLHYHHKLGHDVRKCVEFMKLHDGRKTRLTCA